MGTLYYAICDDCKKFTDLDKFWGFDCCSLECKEFVNEGFVFRAMRLNEFIKNHNGHRLRVETEHVFHELDETYFVEENIWPEEL